MLVLYVIHHYHLECYTANAQLLLDLAWHLVLHSHTVSEPCLKNNFFINHQYASLSHLQVPSVAVFVEESNCSRRIT